MNMLNIRNQSINSITNNLNYQIIHLNSHQDIVSIYNLLISIIAQILMWVGCMKGKVSTRENIMNGIKNS